MAAAMSAKFSQTMSRWTWPLAARRPAVTRSESPGRKKPMSSPVSAKTTAEMPRRA